MTQFWPPLPESLGAVTAGTGWSTTIRAVRNGSMVVVAGMLTATTGAPATYPCFTVAAGFRPATYAQAFARNESTGATGWCRIDTDGKASLSLTVANGNTVTVNMAFLIP